MYMDCMLLNSYYKDCRKVMYTHCNIIITMIHIMYVCMYVRTYVQAYKSDVFELYTNYVHKYYINNYDSLSDVLVVPKEDHSLI